MGLFILKRFAEFVPTLFVIVTVTFFLVRLAPGGPFDSEKRVSPEVLAQIEAHYNMDRPLLRQYADYLGGLLRLDFGPSFRKPSRTVREWLFMRLPISIELGLYGLAFALALGLGAGIIATVLFFQATGMVRDNPTALAAAEAMQAAEILFATVVGVLLLGERWPQGVALWGAAVVMVGIAAFSWIAARAAAGDARAMRELRSDRGG